MVSGKALIAKPWQEARPGVRVKLLPQDGELYVFAQSADRVAKERAMRRRQLKWLWGRFKQLAGMKLTREELLMRLGAARKQARTAWRLLAIEVAKDSATFSYRLDCAKLRRARRREGRYLLCTNLTDDDPARLWGLYLQLVSVAAAFRNLKGDLTIRPIFHQDETRIQAHIFIAFLAYCLHVTLVRRLHALAPGLTPRSAIEKFAAVQMIDLHVPTTDGRELMLTRYTDLPPNSKPRINLTQAASNSRPTRHSPSGAKTLSPSLPSEQQIEATVRGSGASTCAPAFSKAIDTRSKIGEARAPTADVAERIDTIAVCRNLHMPSGAPRLTAADASAFDRIGAGCGLGDADPVGPVLGVKGIERVRPIRCVERRRRLISP